MKILVIEDEPGLREILVRSLEKERYITECVSDCCTALEKLNDYDYDCVLLDIMLPDGDGLTVLRFLKEIHKKESVIVISAKDSLEDKVNGLDLGADDYLAKPFHLAELHARIKSVIRRKQSGGEMCVSLGNLNVYPDRHVVLAGGREVVLNRKEFDLLYYFVTNPERLIHKEALAEAVWGDHIDQADSFDFIYSQVKNLRRKMKLAGASPEIKSVYGFGYKLCADER